jgi:hypothetical protein
LHNSTRVVARIKFEHNNRKACLSCLNSSFFSMFPIPL